MKKTLISNFKSDAQKYYNSLFAIAEYPQKKIPIIKANQNTSQKFKKEAISAVFAEALKMLQEEPFVPYLKKCKEIVDAAIRDREIMLRSGESRAEYQKELLGTIDILKAAKNLTADEIKGLIERYRNDPLAVRMLNDTLLNIKLPRFSASDIRVNYDVSEVLLPRPVLLAVADAITDTIDFMEPAVQYMRVNAETENDIMAMQSAMGLHTTERHIKYDFPDHVTIEFE